MKRVLLVLRIVAGLLVVAALPVTVARITGWSSDLGVVLVSLTPLALLPYAAALALLGGCVVAGRRARVEVGATGLVAVALVLHGWWFAPLVVGGAPEPAAGAERVTVMSANVLRGAGDADTVVEAVRDDEVDVLVVSEVTPEFVAAAARAGLDDLLPRRLGEAGAGTEGTLVWSNDRLEEVDSVSTLFDSLVVRTHGLTLLATHPAPPTLDVWGRDQRLVVEAASVHEVDAVVGDLNATLDHPSVRDLVADGWRDAVELTNGGWSPTWPARGEGSAAPFAFAQIDHVLVRDTFAVTETHSVDVPDADHLAVVATLAATA